MGRRDSPLQAAAGARVGGGEGARTCRCASTEPRNGLGSPRSQEVLSLVALEALRVAKPKAKSRCTVLAFLSVFSSKRGTWRCGMRHRCGPHHAGPSRVEGSLGGMSALSRDIGIGEDTVDKKKRTAPEDGANVAFRSTGSLPKIGNARLDPVWIFLVN